MTQLTRSLVIPVYRNEDSITDLIGAVHQLAADRPGGGFGALDGRYQIVWDRDRLRYFVDDEGCSAQLEVVDFGSHDGAVMQLRDKTPVIWLGREHPE